MGVAQRTGGDDQVQVKWDAVPGLHAEGSHVASQIEIVASLSTLALKVMALTGWR